MQVSSMPDAVMALLLGRGPKHGCAKGALISRQHLHVLARHVYH